MKIPSLFGWNRNDDKCACVNPVYQVTSRTCIKYTCSADEQELASRIQQKCSESTFPARISDSWVLINVDVFHVFSSGGPPGIPSAQHHARNCFSYHERYGRHDR